MRIKIEDYEGFEIYLQDGNGIFYGKKDQQDYAESKDLELLREELKKLRKKISKPMKTIIYDSYYENKFKEAKITSAKLRYSTGAYSSDRLVVYFVKQDSKTANKEDYNLRRKFIKPIDSNMILLKNIQELHSKKDTIEKQIKDLIENKVVYYTGNDIRLNFGLPEVKH